VAQSEDFAEVTRKLEEAEARAGVIRLQDILEENEASEESEDAEAKDEPDAEEVDEEAPSIQRLEAIEILRDYVRLLRTDSTETRTAEVRKPATGEL